LRQHPFYLGTTSLVAPFYMLQSSPKEDHNTFRTTPQEHWWI